MTPSTITAQVQFDPHALVQIIYLLIAGVVLVIFIVLGGLLVMAVVRSVQWRAAAKRAQRQARAAKFRPDGQPYPPAAQGICDRCQQPFDKVYYLPSGKRLCPGCYQQDAAGRETRRPGIEENPPRWD